MSNSSDCNTCDNSSCIQPSPTLQELVCQTLTRTRHAGCVTNYWRVSKVRHIDQVVGKIGHVALV